MFSIHSISSFYLHLSKKGNIIRKMTVPQLHWFLLSIMVADRLALKRLRIEFV